MVDKGLLFQSKPVLKFLDKDLRLPGQRRDQASKSTGIL